MLDTVLCSNSLSGTSSSEQCNVHSNDRVLSSGSKLYIHREAEHSK